MSTRTAAAEVLSETSLFQESAYVDGRWVSHGESGRFSVDNPSTGATIADLPSMSRAQVADAITAAGRALPDWRARSGKQRAQVLRGPRHRRVPGDEVPLLGRRGCPVDLHGLNAHDERKDRHARIHPCRGT